MIAADDRVGKGLRGELFRCRFVYTRIAAFVERLSGETDELFYTWRDGIELPAPF